MMKTLTLLSLAVMATAAQASEPAHTTPAPSPAPKSEHAPPAPAAAPAPAPQVNAMFRVLKADGSTVIGQALITPQGSTAMQTLNVRQVDAIAMANGRCAFNVKYDEISSAAADNTTNRLYSNDTLVAQNTGIALQAGVLRTIWTQPYLYAGTNNVKVVLNADSAHPVTEWVRVNVDGTCGAAPAPAPAASAPAPAPTAKPPAPAPVPAPVRTISPGSGDWNNLYTAWGYSNYAVTQLKGKGYSGYDALVKVNADLGAVVAAGKVGADAYAALMARWNAIVNDAKFKAAMAALPKPTGGK